jgi:DNA-binding response OmpR family regulator
MAKDNIKLLVVDDEEGIVDYVKKLYDLEGFITFGATDGAKAVEIFKAELPQLVILDVFMPYSPIDGIETLRQIKQIEPKAVCVMVTRIADKEKIDEARKLGAAHYIIKPIDIEELKKVIDEAKTLII